jgi:hypothetical protein
MPKVASFYEEHFGFRPVVAAPDKIVLFPKNGCALMLLQASRGHRIRQSCVKIVFDVPDVHAFKEAWGKSGFKFGTITSRTRLRVLERTRSGEESDSNLERLSPRPALALGSVWAD